MRVSARVAAMTFVALGLSGCTIQMMQPAPATAVETDGPLVQGPGVLLMDDQPPPDERVYVYDPGYPPGTYYYGDYYYCGRYRYQRDVFVNRVVVENVRQRRYVDVNDNRRQGQRVVVQQRAQYARGGNGGAGGTAAAQRSSNPNGQALTQQQRAQQAQQQRMQQQAQRAQPQHNPPKK